MSKRLMVGGLFAVTMASACGVELAEPGQTEQTIERHGGFSIPNNIPIRNDKGFATSVHTTGKIDLTNEFFQDLGTNGRRCVSCHLPTAGWTITPEQVRDVFNATRGGEYDDLLGLGAIFRTNDGANSPEADVSTFAKRKKAYSQLLDHGLIRTSMAIPAGAEFQLVAVDDPYHHSTAADLSMYRRPLPTVNIKFLSTIMWDGREVVPGQTIHFDLDHQSNTATTTHAQGDPLDDAQRESIVNFEEQLFFAQIDDDKAGDLDSRGGEGGPRKLITQDFHIGINDNFGDCIDPDNTGCRVVGAPLGSGTRGAPFTPNTFTIYDAWTNATGYKKDERKAVARGQKLFNTRPINISGVAGLNDEAAFGNPALVVGSCTTCHDTPNSGNHSVVAPLNIGLVAENVREPHMPLYTLGCSSVGIANGVCTAGQTIKVTDPGRAMISGKWKHIGRFKGPVLRGLAARAPYFHNGLADSLDEAVDFYNTRFNMGLSNAEHKDLVAFLRTL
jgi:cytochrome c peroxidase